MCQESRCRLGSGCSASERVICCEAECMLRQHAGSKKNCFVHFLSLFCSWRWRESGRKLEWIYERRELIFQAFVRRYGRVVMRRNGSNKWSERQDANAGPASELESDESRPSSLPLRLLHDYSVSPDPGHLTRLPHLLRPSSVLAQSRPALRRNLTDPLSPTAQTLGQCFR